MLGELMLRGVIFDLDGVLINACEWHRVALNEALKEVCDYEILLQDHIKTYNGLPTKTKLIMLTDVGLIPASAHAEIFKIKQEKTLIIVGRDGRFQRDKRAMMIWLRKNGVSIGCYTNSIRETAVIMLAVTGILDLIQYTVTNEDVVNAKPDPEGYIKSMKALGLNAHETWIVEDSPIGILAAQRSKANVIRVDGPDDVDIHLFEGIE